jgi:hypothetical protein
VQIRWVRQTPDSGNNPFGFMWLLFCLALAYSVMNLTNLDPLQKTEALVGNY